VFHKPNRPLDEVVQAQLAMVSRRLSISHSIRAARPSLTGVIGNRTSALSISPARHSQCLKGAGVGSANSSRCKSQSWRQAAKRARPVTRHE